MAKSNTDFVLCRWSWKMMMDKSNFFADILKNENRLENERFTFENRAGILKPSQRRTPTSGMTEIRRGFWCRTKEKNLELENGSCLEAKSIGKNYQLYLLLLRACYGTWHSLIGRWPDCRSAFTTTISLEVLPEADFVGFKNFIDFLTGRDFIRVFKNTIMISFWQIVWHCSVDPAGSCRYWDEEQDRKQIHSDGNAASILCVSRSCLRYGS